MLLSKEDAEETGSRIFQALNGEIPASVRGSVNLHHYLSQWGVEGEELPRLCTLSYLLNSELFGAKANGIQDLRNTILNTIDISKKYF